MKIADFVFSIICSPLIKLNLKCLICGQFHKLVELLFKAQVVFRYRVIFLQSANLMHLKEPILKS